MVVTVGTNTTAGSKQNFRRSRMTDLFTMRARARTHARAWPVLNYSHINH